MKKFTAAAAVLAAAGFTGLSMVPASAAPFAFDRCADAYAAGVGNIPSGQPGYGLHLDEDEDGIGCENKSYSYNAALVPGYVAPTPEVAVPNTVTPEVVAPAPTTTGSSPFVFDNCSQAASFGVYNIPVGSPGYGPHLDSDLDGIGCENGNYVYDSSLVPVETAPGEYQHEIVDRVPAGGYDQVAQVPVGGADTGVIVEESSSVSGLALGGMALVAAAGATFMVRRRVQA